MLLKWLDSLNLLIFALFFACYGYQIVYVIIRFLKKLPRHKAGKFHKYAAIIAARNESKVIGELLESLKLQNYPSELLDIIVVADNCTDNTAEIAREHGAKVFERNNMRKVGKGYALNFVFKKVNTTTGLDYYDGFLVFDADNVLDENYVQEMNNVFDGGYRVVTSYRNSKNYGANWISAGYALWFLRESKYLNGARMICKTSCAISGTGFLVSSEIIKNDEGWKYYLLTEDIEFTVDKIINDEVIGYCESAILYDEQPVNFSAAWHQRLRWARGFYQVVRHYGAGLISGCFKKFQCFDMLMTVAPATLLTLTMLVIDMSIGAYGLITDNSKYVIAALYEIWSSASRIYISLFLFGLITSITEWKQIYCSNYKKILYMLTFPIFMFTYVPIAIAALYKNVTWVPIRHTYAVKAAEITRLNRL